MKRCGSRTSSRQSEVFALEVGGLQGFRSASSLSSGHPSASSTRKPWRPPTSAAVSCFFCVLCRLYFDGTAVVFSSLGMARGRSRSTLLMNIRYPTPPPPAHAHELRFTDDPLLVTAHRPLHPLLRPCPRAPDARESSFCRGISGPDPEQHPSGRVSSSCSFEAHAGTTRG